MKFNYNTEKKKYIRKWEVLEKEYETAGMDKSSIEEMKRFDWELFKKERVFCRHNQYLEVSYPYNEGKSPEQNSLMLKFIEKFSYEERYFQDSRYGWIEEIENTSLIKKIKNLNISEIEILTMYVFEEKSQTEIAEKMNITQPSISRRIRMIKKKLN